MRSELPGISEVKDRLQNLVVNRMGEIEAEVIEGEAVEIDEPAAPTRTRVIGKPTVPAKEELPDSRSALLGGDISPHPVGG